MSTISCPVRTICATIRSYASQIRLRLHPPPSSSQPQSPPSIDPESQLVITPVLDPENQNQILLQWKNIAMGFCFTSALEISLLFAQTKSQLSISFHLLSFAILLIFLCLFVSNFIAHKFPTTVQVMEKIAVLLAATVVVFAIAIPFPLSLKCVIWALYVISLIAVLVGQYYGFQSS
ncbi:hypothetical protein ACOSQ2_006489 [Xanthoceras sorbifolium]